MYNSLKTAISDDIEPRKCDRGFESHLLRISTRLRAEPGWDENLGSTATGRSSVARELLQSLRSNNPQSRSAAKDHPTPPILIHKSRSLCAQAGFKHRDDGRWRPESPCDRLDSSANW